MSSHSSTSIVEFADDTVVLGRISNNDETTHLDEVERLMVLFHCVVRLGSSRLSSGRFAFPPQFSTALEWAGLFMCHYSCATSTAVTSS